ncbi:MAG: hypothetical protein ACRDWV_11145 [Acidimicrobiales bacterium]
MRTLILETLPFEVERQIEDRRAKGHLSPAPRPRHAYLDDAVAAVPRPHSRAAA